MGHYHHMHVTFVFEGLPKDIVEMLDLQDKWYHHDKFSKQTRDDVKDRYKECYDRSNNFARKAEGSVFKFVDKWGLQWDDFMLYENEYFEWVCQGIEWPSGWESSGVHGLHAQFMANSGNMGAFKDFLELVRPYIKSGSAWGWWESDASAFEVFY